MRPRLEKGISLDTHSEEGWNGHRGAESSYGTLDKWGSHEERWEGTHTDAKASGWCGKITLGVLIWHLEDRTNTYGKPLTGRRFAGTASYTPGAPT